MARLSDLPAELVELIIAELAQAELHTFALLTKSVHTLTVPYLYRHVDLLIKPGKNLPRIDRFCMNIIDNPHLRPRIETLAIGVTPCEGLDPVPQWLHEDKHFDNDVMFEKAKQILDGESLVTAQDYLRDAIGELSFLP